MSSKNQGGLSGDIISESADNSLEIELEECVLHPERSESVDFLKKVIIVSPLLLALLVLIYSSPISKYLSYVPEFSVRIRETGVLAPIIFIIATAILISLGMPRLIFCPIAGMIFGFFMGLIWVIIATVAGYYLFFLFVRKTREIFWGKKKYNLSSGSKIYRLIREGGIPGIILVRQLPIHGIAVNVFLSLSGVSHFNYLVGTAIGILPETVPAVLLGTSAAQGCLKKSAFYLIAAVVFISLIWLAIIIYGKFQNKKRVKANE